MHSSDPVSKTWFAEHNFETLGLSDLDSCPPPTDRKTTFNSHIDIHTQYILSRCSKYESRKMEFNSKNAFNPSNNADQFDKCFDK